MWYAEQGLLYQGGQAYRHDRVTQALDQGRDVASCLGKLWCQYVNHDWPGKTTICGPAGFL